MTEEDARADATSAIDRAGRRLAGARRRQRMGGTLVVVLALLGALANAVPAHAEAPGDRDTPSLPGLPSAATPGVSEQTPASSMRPKGQRLAASAPSGTGITVGEPKAGPAPRMREGAQEDEPAVCTPYISRLVTPNGTALTRVDYLAEIVCNFYLAGYGQAYLIERTGGARYNGYVLAAAAPFAFSNHYYGYSIGAVLIDGRLYDGGRQLEIGFDLTLQTLNGAPWGGCFTLPNGQRYLSPCYGLGTSTLSVSIGSGVFTTNLGPHNPAAVIRDIPAISLLTFHVSGHSDPASTARQNIVDAAAGLPAKTSDNSHVGRQDVYLDMDMLRGMLALHLLNGFNFRVTSIAGGVHGDGEPPSRHYLGKAFDVDIINGASVAGNPFVQAFKDACRAYGATEVLGPGDAGHDRHIHCAWPR